MPTVLGCNNCDRAISKARAATTAASTTKACRHDENDIICDVRPLPIMPPTAMLLVYTPMIQPLSWTAIQGATRLTQDAQPKDWKKPFSPHSNRNIQSL